MRTLKIVLAYDGSRYVGWQRQASGVSIQALLEEALAPLQDNRDVRVAGAGRTDAGVHACGQVVSCRVHSNLDVGSLQRALNARLPEDVRVVGVSDAPSEFHARFWAVAKTYVYQVFNAPVVDPLAHRFVWHVPQRLDEAAMRAALTFVQGTHDFKAFQGTGTRVTTTVRTLHTADIEDRPWTGILDPGSASVRNRLTGGLIPGARLLAFTLRGDGFLRHMVRNLVGTVVEVGLSRRDPSSLARILESRDRRQAGITAPPQGLFLVSVEYGDGPAPVGESPALN